MFFSLSTFAAECTESELTACDITVNTTPLTSKVFKLGASGGYKKITLGSNCIIVTNTSANIVFIPLRTSYEWYRTITSGTKPGYISTSNCP